MRIVVKPSRSQQPSAGFLNSGVPEKKLLKGTLGFGFILLVFLVVMPLAAIIFGADQSLSPLPIWLREVRGWARGGLEDGSITSNGPKDKLLGGLLPAGFDEGSCLSRYQSASYRTASPHFLSRYLSRRLRKYEALHRRCGPNTELYNRTVEQLKNRRNNGTSGCNYVVWIPFSGLGNRMLTLASAFLYALLTNRVLLIHADASMTDLFCEPFPHTSWLLPSDFPMKGFPKFSRQNPRCYGKMLRRTAAANSSDEAAKQRLPAHVYLHLFHDYDDFDMHFFCEDDQLFLRKIPWLVIGSDNYFAPSLFSIPSYEEELSRLFPESDTVFHHLGRYLFHPTNTVWGMITRFYQAYLAEAKERVGIQIRIFNRGRPYMHTFDQILACSLRENLLPDINLKEPIVSTTNRVISKAVLVTCLHSEVYEKMKTMFYEHPAVTGEIIGVYQPSHEEVQQTKEEMHNKKAWAEIYLLSWTDVLVTSAWSTFGYVAQGLGGLKPWILIRSENMTMPDPPCRRALSMDPCFHNPPTYYCNGKRDDEVLVSHVRHCEDISSGLKLVHEA